MLRRQRREGRVVVRITVTVRLGLTLSIGLYPPVDPFVGVA
ncbi:hypothetical protein DM2_2380 [Halorubrum sp. DM2]|nr:hypothetical protein DM2_2380 [Halorubrum sp. DM2]